MALENVAWSKSAWKEYISWLTLDRNKARRINDIVEDILRHGPMKGIGKPEVLKHLSGCYSRRISEEHRLVYKIINSDTLFILSCTEHYK